MLARLRLDKIGWVMGTKRGVPELDASAACVEVVLSDSMLKWTSQ